mgnify:FL=1
MEIITAKERTLHALTDEYLGLLVDTELFSGISIQEIRAMLACLGAQVKTFEKGNLLVSPGQPLDSLVIMLEGQSHIVQYDLDGNRFIRGDLAIGDCFGDTTVCARQKTSDLGLEARTDTKVLVVKYQRVVTTCSSACQFHARLIQNLLKVVATHNNHQAQQLEVLTQKTLRDKLWYFLRSISHDERDSEFEIPFAREELAAYLRCDRSALAREISNMVAEGLIKTPRRQTFILCS